MEIGKVYSLVGTRLTSELLFNRVGILGTGIILGKPYLVHV